MTRPLTKKQQTILKLCLNELSINQALLALEEHYGEEKVYQTARVRIAAFGGSGRWIKDFDKYIDRELELEREREREKVAKKD